MLSYIGTCAAQTAAAPLSIKVTVLPTRAQALRSAEIRMQQPDGTTLVLNKQQQAKFVENPQSLQTLVLDPAGDKVRVTVQY